MAEATEKRFYIAGKMTGLPEFGYPAFAAAAKRLRYAGFEVCSPAEVNPNPNDGRTWADYMRRDIPALLGCDAVAVLNNWRDSKGARLEVHIARELGMPVVCAETLDPIAEEPK